MDGLLDGWIVRGMDGLLEEWMDGWLVRGMDGWMAC